MSHTALKSREGEVEQTSTSFAQRFNSEKQIDSFIASRVVTDGDDETSGEMA